MSQQRIRFKLTEKCCQRRPASDRGISALLFGSSLPCYGIADRVFTGRCALRSLSGLCLMASWAPVTLRQISAIFRRCLGDLGYSWKFEREMTRARNPLETWLVALFWSLFATSFVSFFFFLSFCPFFLLLLAP